MNALAERHFLKIRIVLANPRDRRRLITLAHRLPPATNHTRLINNVALMRKIVKQNGGNHQKRHTDRRMAK